MKRYELKQILLNNLEEYGREIIEESIRSYGGNYDLCIYFDEDGNISNGHIEDEYNFFRNYTILYNFKHGNEKEFFMEFEDGHDLLLELDQTEEEDFEKWFENECDLDSTIDIYEEIIQDKIEELFPEEEMKKEKQEEQNKRILHSYIVGNCRNYIENHGFDFEKDFYTLCDEFVEFLYEEFEESKKNNNTKKMNKIIEFVHDVVIIKDHAD